MVMVMVMGVVSVFLRSVRAQPSAIAISYFGLMATHPAADEKALGLLTVWISISA